ncbi:glycoside hydrolase family 55 protein [Hyaloscypha variabilis F]|uniref:Glycoside hydrolase family 55 protein n=1 Tax=Hyaloscypha variabilis (strain UAMH 11265 / GT02V1 / F) TaxID=1149755 RepID=A0A2J6RLD2_HYAVF|nr:glycoside hydrolase family 55 protein [Hyaloscypha variabilis F]
MSLFYLALGLLGAVGPVAAAQVSIPQVSSVVSKATSSFAPAVTYVGPTGSASSALKTSSTSKAAPKVAAATPSATPYWLESIAHQGISAFNSAPASYQVFRNVKNFGAKGDGVTDDTAAIQAAMSSSGRCAPGSCQSSTTTPAIVYFPAGTYIVNSSIIDYYYTQIIGNPNSMPVLKATPNFSGFGIIDGDQYGGNGLKFGATDVFYRQIRNLIFDLTAIPASSSATGVHWPTAQATSLQNCVFLMSDAPGTQHQGLFIENGSGGFMNDLVFYGGLNGVVFGNQQFTVRNLTFYNAVTAIDQIWDWGWTYTGISINNCTTGLNMAAGGTAGQSTGSVTFLDSSFTNTKVAIVTAHNASSFPATAGSLILENIVLTNTPVAVQGPQGTVLVGGSLTISGWGEGHEYTPIYKKSFENSITKFSRPTELTKNGQYYARSKPQYQASPLSQFVSVRTAGAKGNGVTDDTAAINKVLKSAAAASQIVFFDAGTYKVTSTITIPPGSKVVGESYSVIMGAGSFFSSITSPQPVVAVGTSGQSGIVEWSDMIVSTQGATAGAILIQWNLASTAASPSGIWDVHTRIGGFAGSNLQLAQCPTTPKTTAVNKNCIAAFMSMYIAPSATGLYMENNWLWTADHDIEDPSETQITVYTGRGLYCASTSGTIWMVGTAVEHHALYQYQFANTKNVFAGQIQTETAYWQPNPNASVVFPIVSGWNDPNFATACVGVSGQCNMGWGLRVVNSSSILVYGAGLYSFFNNYSVTCSNSVVSPGNGGSCQTRIFSVEGTATDIDVYNLNTVGATQMVTRDGSQVALFGDNVNVYPDTIAYYKSS